MTFKISYKKTGKSIEITNKQAYLMMSSNELELLGFRSGDVWEN